MTSEEYNQLLMQKDVLDHTTLNITVKELTAQKEFRLVEVIQKILADNKIEKPTEQEKILYSTNFYKVDVAEEDIDRITEIFSELENSFVAEDGTATATASFYGSLADKWYNLGQNISQ